MPVGIVQPGQTDFIAPDRILGGAGPFYEKCGYRPVGRVTYRKTPLAYFELLL
jgi:hypothetical protein